MSKPASAEHAASNVIQLGGTVSTIGAALQGYAQGGIRVAVGRTGLAVVFDTMGGLAANSLFKGFGLAAESAAGAELKQIPEALMNTEAACAGG